MYIFTPRVAPLMFSFLKIPRPGADWPRLDNIIYLHIILHHIILRLLYYSYLAKVGLYLYIHAYTMGT